MDHLVETTVAQSGGIITRSQAVALGLSEREVDSLLRQRRLIAVRTGLYTTSQLWSSWDEHRERPLARVRAAQASIEIEHVFSHESAALIWGLPLVEAATAAPHITRRDKRATRTYGGIFHHGAAYDDDQVEWVEGLPVLDRARTVLDLSRRRDGRRSGLVAADAYLRRGHSRQSLSDLLLTQMVGWPYTRTAARVVREADGGSANAGESLARELVLEAGLGPVETQFPIPHRGGTYFGDIRAGRHIIEFDGRIKYRSLAQGGVADRELDEILWDERSRHRDISMVGLGVSRLVYADFWGAARERAKVRLRADHAEIVARLGRELSPDLESYANDVREQGWFRTS